ncbi:MAG: hypothetical protein ABIN74_07890, partial [Ferruginibacter sp.]
MNKINRTKLFLTLSSIIILTATGFIACKKNTPINTVTTATEFIDYSINGVPYSHVYGVDSLLHIVANNGPTLYDLGSGHNYSTNLHSSLSYLHENIIPGDSKPLYVFSSSITGAPLIIQNPPIMINFTEFGPVGQYKSGNFSGTFKGGPPTNTIY